MKKIITTKHTFSKGILQIHYEVLPEFRSRVKVWSVEAFDYSPQFGEYVDCGKQYSADPDIAFDNEHLLPLDWNGDVLFVMEDDGNHLVKCKYTLLVTSGSGDVPCCIDQDEEGHWIVEEKYVDATCYELKILDSINLQCDNCDVSVNAVNSLLKLFLLQAAAESDAPSLELLFGKMSNNCGSVSKSNPNKSKCNCNG